MQKPQAEWADAAAGVQDFPHARPARLLGCSLGCLFLLYSTGSCFIRISRQQPLKSSARSVLFGALFGASYASRQGLARFSGRHLETHFNQKSLAMAGTTFTLDAVNRAARTRGL